MCKNIVIWTFVFLMATATLFAGNDPFAGTRTQESTPIQFSLWPHMQWPKNENVHGLGLGIVPFGDKTHVIGASIGFADITKNVRGAQLGFYSNGDLIEGAQGGFVNFNKNVEGGQSALYNQTDELCGLQLGLVNRCKGKGKRFGLQIGLVNIMKNGFLPIFPFFNFSKNK